MIYVPISFVRPRPTKPLSERSWDRFLCASQLTCWIVGYLTWVCPKGQGLLSCIHMVKWIVAPNHVTRSLGNNGEKCANLSCIFETLAIWYIHIKSSLGNTAAILVLLLCICYWSPEPPARRWTMPLLEGWAIRLASLGGGFPPCLPRVDHNHSAGEVIPFWNWLNCMCMIAYHISP